MTAHAVVDNWEFQSTLSVRRATWVQANMPNIISISIHALRKESDRLALLTAVSRDISIHALRKESDFLGGMDTKYDIISIHALRKESDAFPTVVRQKGQ